MVIMNSASPPASTSAAVATMSASMPPTVMSRGLPQLT